MRLFNKKKSDVIRRRVVNDDSDLVSTSNTFRRNRTLVGTTSNRFDSVDVESGLKSPRSHVHKLTIRRRKVATILFAIILVIISIWILIGNFTSVVIVNVSDSNISKPVDKSKYSKAISEYLDINPMSRLSFLMDEISLVNYVSSKLPEVLDIDRIDTVFGRTNFKISMRIPVAGWQIDKKQYYVDLHGIPFEVNYFPSSVVQITDNSGIPLQKGTNAIVSKRFLAFVGRVVYFTKLNGYTVTKATLPPDTTRQLTIYLKGVDYYIKLSIDRPAGEQVEDMIKTIKYLKGRAKPLYIDIRVSGKTYYK